ncbi:hypothetical protein HOLleu_33841 [Holothuria leucospilota]|uniref:Carboxymuconolactone decarboxylase-like domain-containing protein n=1 Tax=Holothuria leucospilota TaxID=206669 RepID=A0A9Q0YRC0_HOLLE|nr:hypothetical protein HOLleu_33841 [Holothuria leucospilota]
MAMQVSRFTVRFGAKYFKLSRHLQREFGLPSIGPGRWHSGLQCSNHSQRYFSSDSEAPPCRYQFPERASLPDDIKKVIDEVEEKAGFVPNVFSKLSRRPDEFRAFFMFEKALMSKETGNLTKADREMIVVATSSRNKCLYCIIAHGALLRIYSKNPVIADQIAANWRTADIDDRQRAILSFAMKVCEGEELEEDDFNLLKKHGLDEEDAYDIGAITALFAMSNRLANVTMLRPNKEFYLMGRVPKEKK